MRILFVSTLYHPYAVGGAEQTVRLLAEGAVRAGDEAVVVTLSPHGRREERLIKGVRVHYLPLFNVYFPHGPGPRPRWLRPAWHLLEAWNPVMARRLCAVLDRDAPDVVNIHNLQGFTSAIWPALARRGLPVVQTLHDHYTVCANGVAYRHGRSCNQPCPPCRALCAPRRLLSRRVDVLTGVSRRLLDRAAEFGAFAGLRDIRVIHGCNTDPPAPRRAGPAPGQPLRLGFLGRLEAIKGVEVVLEAAARIGPERLRLRLGGTGLPEEEARLRARYGGCAEFLGRVEPAGFFAGIDLLVVPSVVEDSLPRVVHEALGAGVPVIGAAIGGIPEMIRDGETGFLVPAGDVAALESLLRRLLDAPPDWAAMSAACLAESGRYSFDRIFEAYRAAWMAAIAARRRSAFPPATAAAAAHSGRVA